MVVSSNLRNLRTTYAAIGTRGKINQRATNEGNVCTDGDIQLSVVAMTVCSRFERSEKTPTNRNRLMSTD